MENYVLLKKAKRRKQKRCVEKLRRDKIKKSVEELALLIPEARKQIALGHRLKQSKILQLVVDYVRFSQQENKNRQQWDNSASNQHGCRCTFCDQRFEVCAHETAPCNGTNLKLSPDSPQSRCRSCSPVEYLQYPNPSDTKEWNDSSPTESSFEDNDVSESFIQQSFLESYRKLSSKSNMESIKTDQEQLGENVDMESIASVAMPPLRALKSLCNSIFADGFPDVSASNGDLVKETYPIGGARNIAQFESDFMLEETKSIRLIPVRPLASPDVPSHVGSESPALWRPWVYERE